MGRRAEGVGFGRQQPEMESGGLLIDKLDPVWIDLWSVKFCRNYRSKKVSLVWSILDFFSAVLLSLSTNTLYEVSTFSCSGLSLAVVLGLKLSRDDSALSADRRAGEGGSRGIDLFGNFFSDSSALYKRPVSDSECLISISYHIWSSDFLPYSLIALARAAWLWLIW